MSEEEAYFADLLNHVGRLYKRTGSDWQGTPIESEPEIFKCRLSYKTINRQTSRDGYTSSKGAQVILMTTPRIHEGDRITVEGFFEEDGLALKSFEVSSVSQYQDEFGRDHHQTAYFS